MGRYVMSKIARPMLGGFVLAVCLAATLPGGFQLRVERPGATQEEALLLVRALGCHQPAQAKVWGTAEGLIGGERQSVPLALQSVGDGVYAVVPQWADEGAWVLSLTGTYRGHVSTVLVELVPDAAAEALPVRQLRRHPTDADVAGALQRVAAYASARTMKASGF